LGKAPGCYLFEGSNFDTSCKSILTDYPDILEYSFCICIISIAVILVYTCFSCCSVCFPTVLERDYKISVPTDDFGNENEFDEIELEKNMTFTSSPRRPFGWTVLGNTISNITGNHSNTISADLSRQPRGDYRDAQNDFENTNNTDNNDQDDKYYSESEGSLPPTIPKETHETVKDLLYMR
jgi:hypothetical protein